ncbi:glycogenin-1a isoform X1 [Anguilla anguilla]|uniref:glycogenin glucosyltransferase n=1 Tax=Anguilla anguilla TaxID=7936 RepID=A0A9D3ME83_ANGAN|nr:glycogenin-1a isoform X1 [Anguilla anguilla]KAG5847355.1 hypothetical protein ANANG_G00125160 [Anguilla anguilla]
MADQAFVTLATNDNYAKGAMVLGRSLRTHKTSRNLVALIGPHVTEPAREVLQKIYDEVRLVDLLDSKDSAHLALMKRPDLGVTFTKLHCWTLTHYSKCVFMDADTLVLSNVDELFDREELSAAPDPGWPDCFNSGVFVFRPSNETYRQLIRLCTEDGSFDGGDQGVLNSFFSNWATADIAKHLPFIYNLSSIAIYSYLPAFKQYGSDAKVVHFLGKMKPWNYSYDAKTKSVKGHSQDPSTLHPDYLLKWWDIYSGTVLSMMKEQYGSQPFYSGCEDTFIETASPPPAVTCDRYKDEIHHGVSQIHVSPPPAPTISSEERKQKWEQGQADYMGMDSFENIQRKLDSFLN